MYDEKITYVDQFITLLLIESSMIVAKSIEVDKAILNDFTNYVAKGKKGIVVKPVHPKLKATFTKLGFRTFPNDKELLTLKI